MIYGLLYVLLVYGSYLEFENRYPKDPDLRKDYIKCEQMAYKSNRDQCFKHFEMMRKR